MKSVNFKSIKINGGFWQKKQQMAQKTTVNIIARSEPNVKYSVRDMDIWFAF
mgnify:CR=1 FL=1